MNLSLKGTCGVAVILAITLCIVIIVTLAIQDGLSAEKSTTAEPYDPQEQATAIRRHIELKNAAATSNPKVLFIGDSLTERWKNEGLQPWNSQIRPLKAFNAGIDNDRTENLLWRIQDGALDFFVPPEVCVLLIGINNLAADGDTPHGVARGVEAVALELLKRFPKSKIIILGLLPSGAQSNTWIGKRVRTNRKLQDLQLPRTTYLDISDAFLNREGGAKTGLTTDGLHLSEEGYNVLAKALTKKIK